MERFEKEKYSTPEETGLLERVSFSDTNPSKKGPDVLPPAVWKQSGPLRA